MPRESTTKVNIKGIYPVSILSDFFSNKKNSNKHEIIDSSEDDIPETNISDMPKEYDAHDLTHSRSKKLMTYSDQYKHKAKLWVNMIDVYSGGALPRFTTKKCHGNCRSKFKTHPVGCPIRYNCIQQSDESKISNLDKQRFEEKLLEANLPTDTHDFFETEGIFCGLNCVKGYILQKIAEGKVRYRKSLTLLSTLQLKLFGEIVRIDCTPSWKLLKEWGGHLDAKELRASVGKLVYIETSYVRRPYMYASASYIRELKLK